MTLPFISMETAPTISSAATIDASCATMQADGDSPSPSISLVPAPSRPSMALAFCSVCGAMFERYKCHLKRIKAPMCSRECNGVVRGEEFAKHAHKGRAAWSPQAVASHAAKMSGPLNPAWRGGAMLQNSKGNYAGVRYIRAPREFLSMARKDGYVLEHRMQVAKAIGRMLTTTEVVHHINHDPLDNRLENLMLFACNADHKMFEARGTPAPVWQP